MDDRSTGFLAVLGWGVALAGLVCMYLALSGELTEAQDVRATVRLESSVATSAVTASAAREFPGTQLSVPHYPEEERKWFRLTLFESIQSESPFYSDEDLFIGFALSPTTVIRSGGDGLVAIRGVRSELHFVLENRTDHEMLVLWDKSTMDLPFCGSVPVIHWGERYMEMSDPTPPTSIAPGESLDGRIAPLSEIYYSSLAEWDVLSGAFETGPFGLTLALRVRGEICQYEFEFLVTPEVLSPRSDLGS